METGKISELKRSKFLYGISFILLASLVLIMSCGTQKRARGQAPASFEELQTLINTKEFEIENNWAIPLNGSMIDLIGNTNYIRFQGDSVDLFLPYFGVRHSGGDYGGREGGIKYKGQAKEFEINENQEKERIIINFEARQGSENYNFRITMFSNGSSNTNVNSSERNSISYRGMVSSLPEQNE